MAEIEPVIIRSSQGGISSYTPSPHEAAFSRFITDKFDTNLGPALVSEYGTLTRSSPPAIAGDTTLAFCYRRFDPSRVSGSDELLQAYKILNPDYEIKQTPLSGDLDQIEREIDEELKLINNLVGDRLRPDGEMDAIQALTDQEYYTLKVANWHEWFEFALFDRMIDFVPDQLLDLGRDGILQTQVPDVYGKLDLEVHYEVFKGLPEGRIEVTPLKFLNRVNKAFDHSIGRFLKTDQSMDPNTTSNLAIFGGFRASSAKHKIHYYIDRPEKVMGEYGQLIEKLVESYNI